MIQEILLELFHNQSNQDALKTKEKKKNAVIWQFYQLHF